MDGTWFDRNSSAQLCSAGSWTRLGPAGIGPPCALPLKLGSFSFDRRIVEWSTLVQNTAFALSGLRAFIRGVPRPNTYRMVDMV